MLGKSGTVVMVVNSYENYAIFIQAYINLVNK